MQRASRPARGGRWARRIALSAVVLVPCLDQVLLHTTRPREEDLVIAAAGRIGRDRPEQLHELRRVLEFDRALFTADPHTLRTLAPDLDLAWPGLDGVRVRTNELGMRMRPVDRRKRPGTLRIACLGDSNTFGWGVPERSCYPRRLETLLRAASPERPVEVLNFGVPGAGSRGAAEFVEHELATFEPDLVTVALGFNDSAWHSGMTDAERFANRRSAAVRELLERSYFAQLLGRWVEAGRVEARSRQPLRRRASRLELAANLRGMIERSREMGARVLLLNACFPSRFAAREMEALSADLGVEYLDFAALLADRDADAAPEPRTVGEWPGHGSDVTLRVRVRAEEDVASMALFSAEAAELVRIDSLPLYLPMQRDERECGTWFVDLQVAAGTELEFSFARDGALTRPGGLAALKGYPFRTLRVGASAAPLTSPTYRFRRPPGSSFMMDRFHPNEAGHGLMARALAGAIARLAGLDSLAAR